MLFEQRSFAKLVPDQSLIVGTNPEGPTHIRAALANDNSFAIIYIPSPRTIKINIQKFNGKVNVKWFSPRTGKKTRVQKKKTGMEYLIPRPKGDQDWILILDRKKL